MCPSLHLDGKHCYDQLREAMPAIQPRNVTQATKSW